MSKNSSNLTELENIANMLEGEISWRLKLFEECDARCFREYNRLADKTAEEMKLIIIALDQKGLEVDQQEMERFAKIAASGWKAGIHLIIGAEGAR